MTQRSLTVVLTGALLAACSKPNPLFLDTWGVASDSGSHSGSETHTSLTEPPPTTTTTTPPTTTTPVTSTTDDDPTTTTAVATTSTTTVDPTETSSGSSSTTGEPFFCNVEMDDCCEVEIAATEDNFFIDALDGVGPGCPLVVNPPADLTNAVCEHWSFGKVPKLQIFNDPGGAGGGEIRGVGGMALRFPMKSGQLMVGDEPVPWALVQSVALELTVNVPWDTYSSFTLALSSLPEDQSWVEGPEMGPFACLNGNSSWRCQACGAMLGDPCETAWGAGYPLGGQSEQVEVAQGPDPGKLAFALPNKGMGLLDAPNGMVVLPVAANLEGQEVDFVPGDSIVVYSAESITPPKLRAVLCMPP